MQSAPTFYVIPGSTVKRVIDDNKQQIFEAVEAAYRLHGAGNSINPDSYFLRYPDNPSARIIALPAHLGGAVQKSGAPNKEGKLASCDFGPGTLVTREVKDGRLLAVSDLPAPVLRQVLDSVPVAASQNSNTTDCK